MSGYFQIRETTHDDLGVLTRLDDEVFASLGTPFFIFRQFLDLSGPMFIVAVDHADAVVGYCVGMPTFIPGSAYVASLGTKQEHRGRGIARALMTELLSRFREAGQFESHLTVDPENQPAVALYLSLGFSIESLKQDYLGPGDHRLVMRRSDPSPVSAARKTRRQRG